MGKTTTAMNSELTVNVVCLISNYVTYTLEHRQHTPTAPLVLTREVAKHVLE